MEFEFTFVVSGVTVEDEEAVAGLRDGLDAMLYRAGGLDLLTVAYEGGSALKAAIEARAAIISIAPAARILRLDRDLVAVHEIAERIGRTRQNVSQWVTGERRLGPVPFPLPEGTAGRSRIWLWSEVNQWLAKHGLDDGVRYPTRDEMSDIDHAMRTVVTMTFHCDIGKDEFAAERQEVREEFQRCQMTGDFLGHLSGEKGLVDAHGRYIVVLASANEPARAVMERIASYGHDVLFVTITDRFVAMTMSTHAPAVPTEVVDVQAGSTVQDWVHLILNKPKAAFVLAADAEVTPRSTLLVDTAA